MNPSRSFASCVVQRLNFFHESWMMSVWMYERSLITNESMSDRTVATMDGAKENALIFLCAPDQKRHAVESRCSHLLRRQMNLKIFV